MHALISLIQREWCFIVIKEAGIPVKNSRNTYMISECYSHSAGRGAVDKVKGKEKVI